MLHFLAICSLPPSEQLAPSSTNLTRVLNEPPYLSRNSYHLSLDLRRQLKHRDDNGTHGYICISLPTLQLVYIDAYYLGASRCKLHCKPAGRYYMQTVGRVKTLASR